MIKSPTEEEGAEGKRTELTRSAMETVCWARVMVAGVVLE